MRTSWKRTRQSKNLLYLTKSGDGFIFHSNEYVDEYALKNEVERLEKELETTRRWHCFSKETSAALASKVKE